MDDDDIRAGFPHRPEHPDFWRLSEIVLQLDGSTEDADFNYGEYINRFIDSKSIVYMADQRVLRLLNPIEMLSVVRRAEFSAMWIDGFLAGRAFQERTAAAPPTA